MARTILKNVRKVYPQTEKGLEKAKKAKGDTGSNVNKLFVKGEGIVAVKDFSIDIADKEFIVLVGPSGCGKSTTLRMIAGLEEISSGELYIDGKLVNDIPPKDRDIAMVFQNYALYPHMTVYENMAFALKLRKYSKEEIDQRVRKAAEILEITEYLDRKPKALSGGQRQRVAIGRAIVREPKVFLMDEPLSNLDAKLRNQMRAEIIKLRKTINTTFVYVTHDQTEAMTLGDRIVVMKDGDIQQIGTSMEVFHHPKNLFVAGFIGMPRMNFFDAELKKENDRYSVEINGKTFILANDINKKLVDKNAEAGRITLGVRPENVEVANNEKNDFTIETTVDVSEMMGSSIHLHCSINDTDVIAVIPTENADNAVNGLKFGSEIKLAFNSDAIHLFDADGNNILY